MKHICKYCKKEFEAGPKAETCSTICRASFSHVKRYLAVWGISLPSLPDTPAKHQEQPQIKPKAPQKPEIKPIVAKTESKQERLDKAQKVVEETKSRWQLNQEYKKRMKFKD